MNTVCIRPVDPDLNAHLPAAFRSNLMNPAVLTIAAGMHTHARREGYEPQAELILNEIAAGFCRRFDETRFNPKPDDPHFVRKNALLAAISAVAARFEVDTLDSPVKTLIPVQVFEAYAYNATSGAHTMVNPTDSNWWIRPAALHAARQSSQFSMLMDAATSKATGHTVHHVSCCGCSIEPATVIYDVKGSQLEEIAAFVSEWLFKMCYLEVVHSHREFAPTLEFPLEEAA